MAGRVQDQRRVRHRRGRAASGYAIAEALAREGARVALADMRRATRPRAAAARARRRAGSATLRRRRAT